MQTATTRLALVLLLALGGCLGLSLPDPPPGVDVTYAEEGPAASPPGVAPLRPPTVIAPADLRAVPRGAAFRLRFDRALASPCPEAVALVRGIPTAAQALSLARGLPTTAVAVAGDTDCAGDTVTLRPRAPLDAATAYTLVVTQRLRGHDGAAPAGTEPTTLRAETLSAAAADPLLSPGQSPRGPLRWLWVRSDRPVALGRGDATWWLRGDGGDVALRAQLDCWEGPARGRCVRLEGRAGPVTLSGPSVVLEAPEGAVTGDSGRGNEALRVALGRAMDDVPGEEVAWGPSPRCAAGERAVSPLCLDVDDRAVTVRGSARGGGARVHVRVEAAGAVRGALGDAAGTWAVRVPTVAPGVVHALTATLLGADGAARGVVRVASLAVPPARAHLRITEVVARPGGVGRQEFVELFNEGEVPVVLTGWVLALGTGRSPFPAGAVVPARGFAVLTGATFDPRGDTRAGDAPLAAGAALIPWTGTLGGRGLRDAGGRVAIIDPTGRVESEHPGEAPSLVPRAGVGVVRAADDLDEADPAAWAYDPEGRNTPGR